MKGKRDVYHLCDFSLGLKLLLTKWYSMGHKSSLFYSVLISTDWIQIGQGTIRLNNRSQSLQRLIFDSQCPFLSLVSWVYSENTMSKTAVTSPFK